MLYFFFHDVGNENTQKLFEGTKIRSQRLLLYRVRCGVNLIFLSPQDKAFLGPLT